MMAETTRREFLKATPLTIAGAGLAIAVPSLLQTTSIPAITGVGPAGSETTAFYLYGDGVTDDTAGIQAMLNGETVFHVPTGQLIKPEMQAGRPLIHIPHGVYNMKSAVTGI